MISSNASKRSRMPAMSVYSYISGRRISLSVSVDADTSFPDNSISELFAGCGAVVGVGIAAGCSVAVGLGVTVDSGIAAGTGVAVNSGVVIGCDIAADEDISGSCAAVGCSVAVEPDISAGSGTAMDNGPMASVTDWDI